jgi:hypothetical protein
MTRVRRLKRRPNRLAAAHLFAAMPQQLFADTGLALTF